MHFKWPAEMGRAVLGRKETVEWLDLSVLAHVSVNQWMIFSFKKKT
jgi:hypothetical protein